MVLIVVKESMGVAHGQHFQATFLEIPQWESFKSIESLWSLRFLDVMTRKITFPLGKVYYEQVPENDYLRNEIFS